MTPLELRDEVKRITDPMYDIVCDTNLTQGETLTILKLVRELLDGEIASCSKAVEYQSPKWRPPNG